MSFPSLTREFYTSTRKAVRHYADPQNGIEVFYYEANGKPAAMGFAGRSQKPAFQYYYSTEERRDHYVAEWLKGLAENRQRRAERQQTKREFRHSLKIGDLLSCSWGYEQTNVDFYEVVEVREKSVIIREVAQESEQTQWLAGQCSPVKGKFVGEPMLKRVGEGNRIRMNSYSWASPCGEKEKFYYSQYA